MSHYNVNGGIPKTLIQHLIRWVISSQQFDDAVNEVLQSVLETEITPELIPTGEDEEIQSSEAKVGPYVLQDFSLFQVLRFGFRPSKVAFLAWHAWSDPHHGPPGSRRTSGPLTRSRKFDTGYRSSRNGSTRQPVQAVGVAERSQGLRRRIAVPAGRLAGTVGHVRQDLAGRDRTRGSRGLSSRAWRRPAPSGTAPGGGSC